MAEAVEDAFRYDKLVLATTTYNAELFPFMRTFIEELTERGFKNRTVAFIENGSWAPMAGKHIVKAFEKSTGIEFAANNVTIKSAMNDENKKQIDALAKELAASYGEGVKAVDEAPAEKPKKKYVCRICGYVYEGDELPADFVCPLCGQGADCFDLVE